MTINIKWTKWYLIPQALIWVSQTSVKGSDKQSDSQSFKLFLSHPLQIQELVFQRHDYPELPIPKLPEAPGITFYPDINPMYSAVWQGDAFYISRLNAPEPATNNSEGIDLSWTYGATLHNVWCVQGRQFTYYNGALQEQSIGVPVHDNALNYRNKLLEVLHLGIANLRPGSLRWSGDDWEGLTLSGVRMKGRAIIGDTKQRVMNVEYKFDGSKVRFRVDYQYDTTPDDGHIEPGLPRRFRRTQQTADPIRSPDLVEADFTIRAIVSTSNSIEQLVIKREERGRSRIQSAGLVPAFQETTNGAFFIDPSGRRVAVDNDAHVPLPDVGSRTKSRAALFILCSFGLGGLLLIFLIYFRSKRT